MTIIPEDKKELCERFNRVYDDTYEKIRRLVACHCSDPAELPDILQEIYLSYFRTLEKKGIDYPKDDFALLTKIAQNKLRHYYSLRDRFRRTVPIEYIDPEGTEYCVLTDQSPSPEEQTISRMEWEKISREISRMPVLTRRVLYLYLYENLSLQKISELTGLALSAVKSRIYRAKNQLAGKGEKKHG